MSRPSDLNRRSKKRRSWNSDSGCLDSPTPGLQWMRARPERPAHGLPPSRKWRIQRLSPQHQQHTIPPRLCVGARTGTQMRRDFPAVHSVTKQPQGPPYTRPLGDNRTRRRRRKPPARPSLERAAMSKNHSPEHNLLLAVLPRAGERTRVFPHLEPAPTAPGQAPTTPAASCPTCTSPPPRSCPCCM